MNAITNKRRILSLALLFLPCLAASGQEAKAFNPGVFKLTDLVKNAGAGNYFKIPAKAPPFLREVLASGSDVQFKTTDRGGTHAYISSDLSPNIWINPASPPERLGEAICHELLHFEDMQRFKPITGIKRVGLAPGQSRIFQPIIRDLVNMISHEYVKKRLVEFGYSKPMSDNAESRMNRMAGNLDGTEKAFVSLSRQLAKTPGKKTSLKMGNLQSLYRDLLLMTLRDQLLFDCAYQEDLDTLTARFQALLDFIKQCTSEDVRFEKVYLDVREAADAIRASCEEYQSSDGGLDKRYALLIHTMNHTYKHVGISFELEKRPPKAPLLVATSAKFKPGEPFILDGDFTFSKVRVFTPESTEEK